ncbi:MAG: hypothetical protein ABR530_01585 [Pyrinomonadaceae bacterium]
MVNSEELRQIVDTTHEWLLIRELGKTFPLQKDEIDVITAEERTLFGFVDDDGFQRWRVDGFEREGAEIILQAAGMFGRRTERLRLVPRTSAAVLSAEVETARLLKANEIGSMIQGSYPRSRIGRVALNTDNGRLAQIEFSAPDKTNLAAMADVTGSVSVESILAAAVLWADRLALRKKRPAATVWIVCEKRAATNARRLHALLSDRWRTKLAIAEINRKSDPPSVIPKPKRAIRSLWTEKAPKLIIPETVQCSTMSEMIISLAPDEIDVVRSNHGETLRFLGLPIARVRVVMGEERAWFGVGRVRQIVNDNSWTELSTLVECLKTHRRFDAANRRHEYYRSAPEAWLESILRNNISLLDANLVLSPIYNQFRSSSEKIDLLALRKDGRLVVIELKTRPDREMVFQAVDYWRKIELQRRRGILAAANLFAGREILDQPTLIYLAAPAWSFHRDFEYFARTISSEIGVWRFEFHEDWRREIKVLARHNYSDQSGDLTNR